MKIEYDAFRNCWTIKEGKNVLSWCDTREEAEEEKAFILKMREIGRKIENEDK